jgi:hypothetical protein
MKFFIFGATFEVYILALLRPIAGAQQGLLL